jgi:hypothetical protein
LPVGLWEVPTLLTTMKKKEGDEGKKRKFLKIVLHELEAENVFREFVTKY